METLLQQISKNVWPIHQLEKTAFNNVVNVTNKGNLLKNLKEQNLKLPIII